MQINELSLNESVHRNNPHLELIRYGENNADFNDVAFCEVPDCAIERIAGHFKHAYIENSA